MKTRRGSTWLLVAALVLLPLRVVVAAETELVMFEQDNCEWCEAWTSVIGPIYPKSSEGRRAPLRRVDIHAPRPADLQNVTATRFTPTFVLMHQGHEIGRISGYPGEDFFWGLLDRLMQELPPEG